MGARLLRDPQGPQGSNSKRLAVEMVSDSSASERSVDRFGLPSMRSSYTSQCVTLRSARMKEAPEIQELRAHMRAQCVRAYSDSCADTELS